MTKNLDNKELEQMKDAKFIEKYYWLFEKTEKGVPFYKWFFLQKPKFSKPEIDYDNMTERQKHKRVLLALEKVNHTNPNNFKQKEFQILQPTRAGTLNKLFQMGLSGINAIWIFYTLSQRRFDAKNLMYLASFTLLNNYILLESFNIVKEQFRYRRGLKLAKVYLQKYDNDMKPFVKILNPLASHHDISHIQINY